MMSIQDNMPPESVAILKQLAKDLGGSWEEDHYKRPHDDWVRLLAKYADAASLMSQIVVPRLIRSLSTIPEAKRKTMDLDFLWKKLYGELEKKGDLNEDYPYAQTQIIEAFLGIQEHPKNPLETSREHVTEFGDPLLVTAVIIATNLTEDNLPKKKLNDPEWVRTFSKGVNLIQDIIIRHMIYAETKVIPLVGDTSVLSAKEGEEMSLDDKKTRALGLGKNPTPEMAAILNPGLAMTPEQQQQYHRELVLLSKLITPDPNSHHRSVTDAFENAGFTVSISAEIEPKTKDEGPEKGLQELKNRISALQEGLTKAEKATKEAKTEATRLASKITGLEQKMNEQTTKIETLETQLEDLGKTHQMELGGLNNEILLLKLELEISKGVAPPPPAEKEPKVVVKKTVDYTSKAMNFLIGYLGVEDAVLKLTKNWMELYALKPTHALFTDYKLPFKLTKKQVKAGEIEEDPEAEDVLRVGLSSLIVTHEEIGVMRPPFYLEPSKVDEDEDEDEDEDKDKDKDKDDMNADVTFAHEKMIKIWIAVAEKDGTDQPTQGDLIIQKAQLGSEAESEVIVTKFKEALNQLKASKNSGSPFPKDMPELFTSQRPPPHPHRNSAPVINVTRRRRRRKEKDDRVLVW